MRGVLARVEALAAAEGPVWIHGEAGTETRLLAWALHVSSPRDDGPFVEVSSVGMDENAWLEELFGDQAGFGGKCELAEGGTMFLRDLNRPSAKFEQVLAERNLRTSDGVDSASVPRWVFTSRTPPGAILSPAFTEKLAAATVSVPSLRGRPDEIVAIAQRTLEKLAPLHGAASIAMSPSAQLALQNYPWPGNVRELWLAVERAVLLRSSGVLAPEHFFPADGVRASELVPNRGEGRGSLPEKLHDWERRELLAALDRCSGNKAEVARLLGIQRTTLYYRLKRLGID